MRPKFKPENTKMVGRRPGLMPGSLRWVAAQLGKDKRTLTRAINLVKQIDAIKKEASKS
jgi:hypothetical protein